MSRLFKLGALCVVLFCANAFAQSPAEIDAALAKALTFHASFDHGVDADFSRGDRRIWSAPSYQAIDAAKPGIANPDVVIAKGQGRYGDALQFRKKNTQAVFFRADRNVAYNQTDWNGTISFWLSLSPDADLEPGYTDPLQLTDKEYNDAAIWVDFTRDDTPRHFRLGAFGDLKAWNTGNLPPDKNPFFNERTIVVDKPPFAHGQSGRDVVIAFSGFNSRAGGSRDVLSEWPSDRHRRGNTRAVHVGCVAGCHSPRLELRGAMGRAQPLRSRAERRGGPGPLQAQGRRRSVTQMMVPDAPGPW